MTFRAEARGTGSPITAASLTMMGTLAILWGINFPSIKLAVAELSPWTFRSICVLVGGFGLLAIGRFVLGHRPRVPRDELPTLLVAALFNVAIWQLASAFGVLYMAAGRAVIIAYTMPLWATVMARIVLHERITPSRLAGLIAGLAGLAVLIGPDLASLRAAPLGALLMLGAAISWAAGTVTMKTRSWSTPTVIVTGWQLLLGGAPVVLGALIVEQVPDFSRLTASGWTGLVYSSVVPMIVCHYIWFSLVGRMPAVIAALSTLAIPVVGVYSSALLLDEPVGFRELSALILVVAALGMVLAFPSRPARHRTGGKKSRSETS